MVLLLLVVHGTDWSSGAGIPQLVRTGNDREVADYGTSGGAPMQAADLDLVTNAIDLVVTQSSTDIVEGGTAPTFTVRLSEAPTGNVSVSMTLGSSNTVTLGLNPAGPLTFTTSDWATVQTVTVSVPDDNVFVDETWQTIFLQGSGGGATITTRGRADFSFIDNDEATTVTLSASPNPVTEGTAVTITATLSQDPTEDVTIPLTIPSPGGGEYTSPATAEITITGTGTGKSGTLDIQTNQDADEDDETFTVALDTDDSDWPSAVSAGDPPSVEITIFDDDKPRVSLSASPNPVDEGSTVTLTATLSEDPTSNVTIPLTIPAAADGEYTVPTNAEITIAGAGTGMSGTLEIQTNQDSDKDNETFTVELATDDTDWPSAYGPGTPSSVEITITDDDSVLELMVSQSSTYITEGGTSPTFDVSLTKAPTGNVTVTMTLETRNTVTLGLNPAGPLTFTTTNWATVQTVTVLVPDDNVFVAPMWQIIYLQGSGGGVDTGSKRVLFHLTDNDEDAGPTVSLSASPNPVTEGSAVTLTATLSEDPDSDVTIPLEIPAPGGGEYTVPTNAEITITGTGNVTSGTLEIQTNQDSDKDNETFTVELDTDATDWPSGWSEGTPSSIAITINDDDKPTVSLSAAPNPVDEGSSVTITATLSEDPDSDVTIPLTIPAPADGEYTVPSSAEITIAGSGTGTSGTLVIQTNDDSDMDDETFTVGLNTDDTDWPSAYNPGTASSVEITITDTDEAVTLDVGDISGYLDEGGTSPTFTVKLSGEPTGNVTVTMTLEASNTVTLSLTPAGPLTFTTSDWATEQTVTVSVPDDNVFVEKGYQTIYLEGSGGGFDTQARRTRVLAYFTDNDEATTVTLSASPNPVTEGTAVTITATLSQDPTEDVTIPLTIPSPGGGEYTSPATAEITITGTGTGKSGTLDIQTNQDADEDDETFTVALDTDDSDWPSAVSAGDPPSVEITIFDDDKPRVSLSASPNPVDEGSTVTLTATLSEDPTSNVTIPLTIPAAADGEYTVPTNAEITIAGAGTGMSGTLEIQTNQDSDKDNETFTVELATDDTDWPSAYGPGTPSSVEITITDDDSVLELMVSQSSTYITEGGTSPTFDVSLTKAPTGNVTVTMTLETRNTVTLGLNPAGPLTFTTTNWATVQTVTVLVPDDNVFVAPMWQIIYLQGSGGGVDTGSKRVLFHLTDNDEDAGPTVSLSASPNPVTEGSAVTLTATLSEDPDSDVTIPLEIPAPGGGEYTVPTNAEITITGTGNVTSGTLEIQTNQDSDKDNETFTVELDTDATDWPSGWSEGTPSSIAITINDDDKPTVSLSAAPNPVDEGSSVTITATLSEDPDSDVTIPLTIPAPADGEYTVPSSAEITIAGSGTGTSGTLVIQTNDDSDMDDETFTVGLNTDDTDWPSAYNPGTASSVEITITDTDEAVTLEVSGNWAKLPEGGTAPTFKVWLSEEPTGNVTVTMTLSTNNSAMLSLTPAGPLTFTTSTWAEADGQTVTVSVPDNDVDETDGWQRIHLDATGGGADGARAVLDFDFIDNDVGPNVTLSASPNPVTEGSAVTLTATLSGDPDSDVTIPLTIPAPAGGEYTVPSPAEITITGSGTGKTGTLDIQTNQDANKVDETFTVELDDSDTDWPSDWSEGDPSSVDITITDDDKPTVSLSASPNPVTEGTVVTITATLSEDPTSDVTIPLTIPAPGDGEYTVPTLAEITIAGSGTGTTGSLNIQTNEDADRDDETFAVQLDTGDDDWPSAYVAGTAQSVAITISDDDKATVSLSATPNPVGEGSAVTITATLSEDPDSDVTIPLTIPAPGGGEYTVPTNAEITITGSGTGTSGTLDIQTNQDSDKDDETFTVELDTGDTDWPSGYSAGTASSVEITISDDDKVTVSLSATPNPVGEGSAVTITATLSEDPDSDVTIPLTIPAPGGGEYTVPTNAEITIAGTGTGTTGTLEIQTNEDADRDDETFTVELDTGDADWPSGYVAGTASSVAITINDNDRPTVSLSASPNPVTEGSAVTITATLSEDPDSDVTIPLTIPAPGGGEYTVPTNAEITIAGTGTGTTGTLEIQTNEDGDRVDETFTVRLATGDSDWPSGYDAGTASAVAIRINDNDKVTVSLSASPNPVDEGSTVTITATLSEDPDSDVTIPLTIPAPEGGAYTSPTNAEITITGTGTGTSGTLDIQTNEDSDKVDETFTVQLATGDTDWPSGFGAGTPSSVAITITDNDKPELELSQSATSLNEGGTSQTFSVKLTKVPSATVTITLTPSAENTITLTLNPSGPLTFTTDNWGEGQTVTVSVADNTIIEEDKAQHIDLTASGGGADGQTTRVGFDFKDNDKPELEVTQSGESDPGMPEGGDSPTFSVKLTKAPNADVTVTLTPHADNTVALTLDPSGSLTFTTDNWSEAQTVTVSVADNSIIEVDKYQRIDLAASGGGVADGTTGQVGFWYYDNDKPGLEVSSSGPGLNEGGDSQTISVKLTKAPNADVTVTQNLRAANTVALTLDPSGSLTFTTENWSEAQTVTVSVTDDTVINETALQCIDLAASGGGVANGTTAFACFFNYDNDKPYPEVTNQSNRTLNEGGGSETFSVALNKPPNADVTVTLTPRETNTVALTLDPLGPLTFTTDNWNEAQTVTVTAEDNASLVADAFQRINMAASGGGADVRIISVDFYVVDNDKPDLEVSQSSPNIVEGGSPETFSVNLTKPPSADVTVTLSLDAGNSVALTLDPSGPLTFTTGNWSEAQTVTVSVPDNATVEPTALQRINLAASGGGADGKTARVSFWFYDGDDLGLQVSQSGETLIEGGGSETFSLNLTKEPGENVTVRLTLDTGNSVALALDPLGPLTFTRDNWSEAQTVSVSVPENTTIDANAFQRINLIASGGGADGARASVDFWVFDNDASTVAVTLAASPNPVDEGATVTITATLSEVPTADVVIPLTISPVTAEPSDYGGLTTGSITILGAGNENSGTLDIATFEDDSEFDDETFTVALGTLPTGVVAGDPFAVEITIEDNDVRTVTLAASPNPVDEGAAVTVTATLSEVPTTDVVIPLTISPGTAEASDYGGLTAGSITISGTANENSGTLDIATFEDDGEYDDETFTVAVGTLPPGVQAGDPSSVEITIEDNDALTLEVTLSASPNPVEEGSAVTITATLSEVPTEDVVIPLTFTPGTAEISDYGGLTTGSITIPGTGTETTGTLVVATSEDDGEYDDETFTVAFGTLPAGVLAGDPSSVEITIEDNDGQEVTLTASPLSIVEGGIITVTATLSEALPNPVTIGLTDTHISTEPADYDPLASITIPGGLLTGSGELVTNDDDLAESDETFTLALGDLPAGLNPGDPSSVELTILDDGDIPPPSEVSVFVNPAEVNEGGAVTVELQLSETLTADVEVPLTYPPGGMTAEAEDYVPLERVLIPSGQAAGSGQITTVRDMDTDDETFTVALGSLPPQLVAGRETSQTVTIRDLFPSQVQLSASPNPVDEGDEVTVAVELSEALSADVTIPLVLTGVSADAQDYEASSPAQVEIEAGGTRGSYGISILQDHVAEGDETFTVAFGVLSDEVVAVDPTEVEVTITDDDVNGIDAPPSVSVFEGGTGAFDVSLTSVPLDAVTVVLTGYNGTDLTLAPLSLTFTPGDWNQAQQVMLSAAEDSDLIDDEVVVILSATGGGYTGVTDQVLVTVTDNDVPGINAPALVTVAEGDAQDLAVALVVAPSNDVTVTVPAVMGDLSLSPTTLTFTTSNWDTPQMVTLTASEDDDSVDDREEITLTANGGGYVGVTRQVAVTITDNDAAGIVAVAEVTMEEGGSTPLEVRLSAEPSGSVQVAFTGYAGTQLTLDRNTLTFTPTNWNIPQVVTLTAGEDDNDFETDIVDLRLTASGGGYGNIAHAIRVTITDNDRSRQLSLSIYDQRESEGAGMLQLQLELSRATDKTVTVQYETTDVEAEAGADYTRSRGIVIFGPGSTRGTVLIDLIDDNILEEAERFEVTLSNPRNAIIARGTGTGTILDDDGGATLRIDDALALEEEGVIQFRVLLSQPQTQMISVSYRTQDGTAKAGEDYEASSGVVMLPPGTTEAMISVPLLKDGLDWREETFAVHLVSSKQAKITKSVGVATIREATTVSEGILEAYAARFVRTFSTQVVEAIGERFRSGSVDVACGAGARAEMAQLYHASSLWDPSLGELLSGCRMSVSSYDGAFGLWGRGAFRQFNNRTADALTLDGEVVTGMLGVDYRWRRVLAGMLLAHSQGDGSFEVVQQSGTITAGLTGIYPYVSYGRAGWDVWLSAGAGWGQAEVLELKGDLFSRFGAMGVRGSLSSTGAVGLSYHGDVLVTDAEIKDHDVTAGVYRVRAGVEANTRISNQLRPYVVANVRRDGGAAETGVGLEFGGGVRVDYPALRLRGEVHTHGLVMHTAEAFTEWGFSGIGTVWHGIRGADGTSSAIVGTREYYADASSADDSGFSASGDERAPDRAGTGIRHHMDGRHSSTDHSSNPDAAGDDLQVR